MIILLTKYCRKRRKNEKYKKFSKSDLTSVTALPCLHLFEWSANRWTERRDKNHGGDSSSAVRSSALDGCFCPRLYSSSEVRMCDARGAGQPTFETNERRAHGCDGRSLRALDYDDTGRKKNNRTAHFGSVSRAGRARRTRGGKPRMNRGMTERVWSWNEKKKNGAESFSRIPSLRRWSCDEFGWDRRTWNFRAPRVKKKTNKHSKREQGMRCFRVFHGDVYWIYVIIIHHTCF